MEIKTTLRYQFSFTDFHVSEHTSGDNGEGENFSRNQRILKTYTHFYLPILFLEIYPANILVHILKIIYILILFSEVLFV